MRSRVLLLLFFLLGLTPATMAQDNWEAVAGPFGGTTVYALVRHAATNTLYAATQGGLFRSTDQAQNWVQIDEGFEVAEVRTLAFDDAGALLAGTFGGGLYRTADAGTSWTDLAVPHDSITAMHLTDTGILYAGSFDGNIHWSSDQGSSWTSATTGLGGQPITDMASNGSWILACSHAGIFRSNDGGVTWTTANAGLPSTTINALLFVDGVGYLAGAEDGFVYRTATNGAGWTNLDASWSPLTTPVTAFDREPDGDILLSTQSGLLKLNSAAQLRAGYTIGDILIRGAVADDDGYLYAATQGAGVYGSANGGTSWASWSDGITSVITALTYTPGGALIAGTLGGGIFRSTDHGGTWTPINVGLGSLAVRALTSNLADGTLYAGTEGGFVYQSNDAGDAWTDIGYPGTRINTLLVRDDGDLFTGGPAGMRRFLPDSLLWKPTGLFGFEIFAHAQNSDGLMFASILERVMRSPDQGVGWATTQLQSDAQALYVTEDGRVFAGADSAGVYLAYDRGDPTFTWTRIDDAEAPLEVTTFILAQDGAILAGTSDDGVYLTRNDGATWGRVEGGLAHPHITVTTIDPATGIVFVGTRGGGIFRSQAATFTGREQLPQAQHGFRLTSAPNPFVQATTLSFDVAVAGPVSLRVYDLLGREVAVLFDEWLPAGPHARRIDGTSWPSGLYFARLTSHRHIQTLPLTLIR